MNREAIERLRRDAAKDKRRVWRSFPVRIDASAGAVQRPDGAWEFDGVATRGDAVFDYSTDAGKPWREYRPLDQVGAATSLDSLIGAEITDDHPADFVSPENARELGRGTVMKAWMDGTLMRVRVIVRDAEMLKKIFEQGKVELSCGYTAIVVDSPGVHPTEGPYEAIQTQIVHNHLAVVDVARAGPVARLAVPPAPAGAAAAGDKRATDTSNRKTRDEMGDIVINGATFKVDPNATTVPQTVVEAFNQQQQQLTALQAELATLKAAQSAAPAATAPVAPAATPPVAVDPNASGDGKNTQSGQDAAKNKNPAAAGTKDNAMITQTTGLDEKAVKALLDARDAENQKKADKAIEDGKLAARRTKIIGDAGPFLADTYDYAKKSDAEILGDAVVALDKSAAGFVRELVDAKSIDGLSVLLRTKIDAKNADAHRATGQLLASAIGGAARPGNANIARKNMRDRKLGIKPATNDGAAAQGSK